MSDSTLGIKYLADLAKQGGIKAHYELINNSASRNPGGRIVIRPSGIREFQDNPYAWAVKTLGGCLLPGNFATAIGTAVHTAAEVAYKAILEGQELPQKEVCSKAIDKTVDGAILEGEELPKEAIDKKTIDEALYVRLGEGESLDAVKTEAERLFEVYYDKCLLNSERAGAVVASEQRREVELSEFYPGADGIVLAGTLDIAVHNPNGSLTIRDIKTSKYRISDNDTAKAKHGPQIGSYALLAYLTTGKKVSHGEIDLLLRQKTAAFERYTFPISQAMQEAATAIEEIVSTVKVWRDGVDASVLFRRNPESFRGSELNDILQ
jgi:hypothetical protein